MSKNPKVFGSFDIRYDVSEFERFKADSGYYNIDLVPECRVFIFGAEVSADVLSVNISNTVNDVGTCSIALSNPRGKYEKQKNDLCMRWREDKDILSAYNFDFFKKSFDRSIVTRVAKKVTEGTLSSLIAKTGLGDDPNEYQVTRKIFETKFYSGLSKQVGDVVFDYRDPVIVFLKGRFSPYWYFGFTGLLSGFDESNQFESDSVITINCESPFHMWKKQMVVKRSPLLAAGLFEYESTLKASVNPDTGQPWGYDQLNISGMKGLSFNRFVQFVGWGFDSYRSVGNNSLIINNISSAYSDIDKEAQISNDKEARDAGLLQSNADKSNQIDYFLWNAASKDTTGRVNTKSLVRDAYIACKMYDTFSSNQAHLVSMCSDRLIDIKKEKIPHPLGHSRLTVAGCNESSGSDTVEFSAWQGLNLQYIKICPKVFTKENELNKYFDASLRMWEVNPLIPKSIDKSSQASTITGWQDNLCFAVAGTHPALKNNQVDYFKMLTPIWNQISKIAQTTTSDKSSPIDRLIVTPADKIREMVVGSNTAYHCSTVSQSGSTDAKYGTIGVDTHHMSYFRPRLYLIAPRRYNTSKSMDMSQFQQLDLTKMETTSCFDALREACIKMDYCMYATASGDIVVEPYMYDIQPTLFMDRSQYDNFYTDPLASADYKIPMDDPALSNYGNKVVASTINFGERSNHPLTIMNKDITRVTQTFDSKHIATSAVVQTAMIDGRSSNIYANVLEQATNPFELHNKIATIAKDSGKSNDWGSVGYYVAHGIDPKFFSKKNENEKKVEIAKAKSVLEQTVLQSLIVNYPTVTFKHVLLSVAEDIFTPVEWINSEAHTFPHIPNSELDDLKNHNYLFDHYLANLNNGSFTAAGDKTKSTDIDLSLISIYRDITSAIFAYKIGAMCNQYADYLTTAAMGLLTPLSVPVSIDIETEFIVYSKPCSILVGWSEQNSLDSTTELTESAIASYNFSVQMIYERCKGVYEKATSAYTDAQNQLAAASSASDSALALASIAYNQGLMTSAKVAMDTAYSTYISGVKMMWSKIDDLIRMDTSASGKSKYELMILTTFLKSIDPLLVTKSDIKTSLSGLRLVSQSDAGYLTTVSEILNSKASGSANRSITEILKSGGSNSNKESGIDWVKSICGNFLKIFRDYALLDSDAAEDSDLVTAVRKANEDFVLIQAVNTDKKDSLVLKTIADLKYLRSVGLYTPKLDLFRLYGYNPAPNKVFMYVDKKDKDLYAKMYLNQYIGQIYRIHVDMIGRPEISLNRPHYLACKDCIGLSTNYGVSYSYGSDFTTTMDLNYIRKNAFSYAYSNDYMDVVNSNIVQTNVVSKSIKGNARALECFQNYYALTSLMLKATKTLKAAENTVIGGSIVSSNLTNATGIDPISAALRLKYDNCGLHGIYDTIGHVDYDLRSYEGDKQVGLSTNFNSSTISAFDDDQVRLISSFIDDDIKSRTKELSSLNDNLNMWYNSENRSARANTLISTANDIDLDSGSYCQIMTHVDLSELVGISGDTKHPLSTETSCAYIVIQYNDGEDVYPSKFRPFSITSATKINFKFKSSSGIEYSTASIDITPTSTLDVALSELKRIPNTSFEDIVGTETDSFIGLKLMFTNEHDYGIEVRSVTANYNRNSQVKNGWNVSNIMCVESVKTKSSIYSFAIKKETVFADLKKKSTIETSEDQFIDLTSTESWSDVVSKLSRIIPASLVSTSDFGFISIGVPTVGESATSTYIAKSKSGQDLLTALKNAGYSTFISNEFSAAKKYFVKSAKDGYAIAKKDEILLKNKYEDGVKKLKKISKNLYGYFDVDDTNTLSGSDNARLTYDMSEDQLQDIISEWTVTYLQNGDSDVAKSAKNSDLGRLLLAAYDATKLRTYKLQYVSLAARDMNKISGNYMSDKITCYLIRQESEEKTTTANSTTLKKYIWHSSQSKDSESLVFNQSRPLPEEYQEFVNIYKPEYIESADEDDIIDARNYIYNSGIFADPISAMTKIDSFLDDWKSNYMSNADLMVNILGYTSIEGKPDYNQDLASRRANLVSKLFQLGKITKLYGDRVPYERIGAVLAFGEDPLYRRTPENDYKIVPDNRRIEIEIISNATKTLDYTVWEDWND